MKINKEFILKNLMTIICGISIIALFLPFISVKASVSVGGFGGSAESESINGFAIITEGGILGILMELCILLIIASAYIKQLSAFRKIVCAASSVIGLICLFVVPGIISSALAAASGSGGGVSVKAELQYKIGFWILLVCYVALIAMSVIQFFGLKGNKVFDAINQSADPTDIGMSGNGINPNVSEMAGKAANKIKGVAQNITQNVSNAVSNLNNNMPSNQQRPTQSAQMNTQGYAPQQTNTQAAPQQVSAQQAAPQQYAQTAPQQVNAQTTPQQYVQAPPQQVNTQTMPQQYAQTAPQPQAAALRDKLTPEEAMKHIKDLHAMKEEGILTDEEFSAKKQEFLSMM